MSVRLAGWSAKSGGQHSALGRFFWTREQTHDGRLGQRLRGDRIVDVGRRRSRRHIEVSDAECVDGNRVMVRWVAFVWTRSVVTRLGCISLPCGRPMRTTRRTERCACALPPRPQWREMGCTCCGRTCRFVESVNVADWESTIRAKPNQYVFLCLALLAVACGD
jgi:hypothetical protein